MPEGQVDRASGQTEGTCPPTINAWRSRTEGILHTSCYAREVSVLGQLIGETSRGVANGNLGSTSLPNDQASGSSPSPSARMSPRRRGSRTASSSRRPSQQAIPSSRPAAQPHPSEHTSDPSAGRFAQMGGSPNGANSVTCAHWPRSSKRRCPPLRRGSPSRRAGTAAPSWVRCGRRSPGPPGGCPQTAGRPR